MHLDEVGKHQLQKYFAALNSLFLKSAKILEFREHIKIFQADKNFEIMYFVFQQIPQCISNLINIVSCFFIASKYDIY